MRPTEATIGPIAEMLGQFLWFILRYGRIDRCVDRPAALDNV
jgi:hypothetical protein